MIDASRAALARGEVVSHDAMLARRGARRGQPWRHGYPARSCGRRRPPPRLMHWTSAIHAWLIAYTQHW